MAILIFILGVAGGSFLNLVITRTQKDEKFSGRSKCDSCGQILRPIDLIPILSFTLLGGKCRDCKVRIHWQHPVVEFANGIFWAIIYLQTGEINLYFISHALAASFLILIFFYDLRFMMIPDRFTVPAIIIMLLLNFSFERFFTATLVGMFFYAQFAMSSGKWVGNGDIRLGALIGLIFGLQQSLFVLLISYVSGALVGIYLIVLKKAGMKTKLPFGSFLSAASLIMLVAGEKILNVYLSLVL